MRYDDSNSQFDDDAIPIKKRVSKPRREASSQSRQNAVRPARAPSQPARTPSQSVKSNGAAPQKQAAAQRTSSAQATPRTAQRPVSQARPYAAQAQRGAARPQRAPENRMSASPEIRRTQGGAPRASRDRNKKYTTGKFTIPDQLKSSQAQKSRPVRQTTGAQSAYYEQDDIPVAIPVRGHSATRRALKGGYGEQKKKGSKFRKGFLIYLGVLLVLSIIFLIYVHGLLVDFEASQVDNVVAQKLEDIKKAASKGKMESEISLDAIKEKFSPSEDELDAYQKAFALGDLTYKKSRSGLNSETETYAIFLNGFHMGSIEVKNVKEEMVLAIFPVTEWEIVKSSAETFSFDFPASVTITSGGKTVEGKPSETEGLYSYPVSSLFSEDTLITDSAGNTVSFNGKDPVTFVNYTAKVLSNLRVYYGDSMIDPAKAELEEIDAYKYIKEYCDEVPDLAVYRLCLIDNGGKMTVKDQSGSDVEFKQNDSHIEAKDMPKSDTMPEGLAGSPNPLDAAEKLSLLLSDDLGPEWPHGFKRLAEYLLEGSYFYDKYWEFAKGVDITFVSNHTLDNPVFNSEKVSEYVKFSDKCFSCRIEFNKPMYMSNGVNKVDSVNGIYYFVYADDSDDGIDDPHWALVDNNDVAKQIN